MGNASKKNISPGKILIRYFYQCHYKPNTRSQQDMPPNEDKFWEKIFYAFELKE